MKRVTFVPHVCETCGQTRDYEARLDAGTCHIVIAIANAVRRLKRNKVHLMQEAMAMTREFDGGFKQMIAAGYLTPIMIHNAFKARYHGLIARCGEVGDGEYLITRKGADFLRGKPISYSVIVTKVTHTNAGYVDENDKVTIKQLLKEAPWWDISRFPWEDEPNSQMRLI